MRILISGATGLIGSALAPSLSAAGDEVILLSRRPGPDTIVWDPGAGLVPAAELEGFDAVVHLAGEGIGTRRWSEAQRTRILESRTQGTALLASALAQLQHPPARLLSASAIGWYGDRGDNVLTEESERGAGFLSDVCAAWEDATRPAAAASIATTHLRTGIVLSGTGGALAKQLPLFRVGLGGRLGSGRQYMSWISIADEIAAIEFLLRAPETPAAVNLTGPEPVTNADFTKALASVLHRPAFAAAPAAALRLALGRAMANELLLSSARVQPAVLTDLGYRFHHPTVDAALSAAVGSDSTRR